ncbi:hypothetical protein STEG23_020835, partial [Scotinomys teguina]
VPVLRPMDLMVEASPRRVFANAHTYHINSISVNSDYETYMSADDLRINLWNFEITNQSFSILSLQTHWSDSRVSSVNYYFEREVRHLEYVQQRKLIRDEEKKEIALELVKKKAVRFQKGESSASGKASLSSSHRGPVNSTTLCFPL